MLGAAGAEDPAATLRPLLNAALDNALAHGDAALTGPIVRGDVGTIRGHLAEIAAAAPHTLPSYVAMARATLDRVVTDGRVLPIRANRIRQVLDDALAGLDAPVNPHERAIRFDDPVLAIDWRIPAAEVVLSDRDRAAPLLADAETFV